MLLFGNKRRYRLKLFCAIILATLTLISDALHSTENSRDDPFRLPNTSYPLHYDIHLKTNIHRGVLDYAGNCSIVIKVIKKTDQLVLHAHLFIKEVYMTDLKNEQAIEKLKFNQTTENDLLIIKRPNFGYFEKNQKLRLVLKFSGSISTDRKGFQTLTYTNHAGREVIGAYTSFQPNEAHLAIPCYDEPALKAQYVLHITHGSNLTAISNMPQNGDLIKHDDGMVTTNFMESNVMSIYLLAFVLSDFKFSQFSSTSLPLRVFTPDGSDRFNILQNTDWCLRKMGDLFDIPHELQKLDSIIFDYNDGGMENWGLIYYKIGNTTCVAEQCFYDYGYTEYLIFHEISHQWFGNLVTLEWWTYHWLNEGFASYYGHVLKDLKTPNSRELERFRASDCMPQLMSFEYGIMSDYRHKDNLNDGIPQIQYLKSACVIQMFEQAFGQQVFRKGVSMYLKANLFSTTTEDDLFDAIQYSLIQNNSTSQPWTYSVHEIMKSWTHNELFPEVIVERNYAKNNSNIIRVKQTSYSEKKFWIPFTFATTTNPNLASTKADYFLSPNDEEAIIDLSLLNIKLNPDDWLIVNNNAIGYYTVVYDDENKKRLLKTFRENRHSISPLNRAMVYASVGNITPKIKNLKTHKKKIFKDISVLDLELIKSLKNEDDPLVWLMAVKRFNYMPIYSKYKHKLLTSYLKTIIEPQYNLFQRKSSTTLKTIELFMFKELQALARNLDLKTALEDQVLTESYLKRLNYYLDNNIEINDNFNWNSFVCRTVKNVTYTDFKVLVQKFESNVHSCFQWFGLLCAQQEESVLHYFEVFQNTFKHGDNHSHNECSCRLTNTLAFLLNEFTTIWDKAWKINNDEFNRDKTCSNYFKVAFIQKFDDITPVNLEKFQDAFKGIKKMNDAYEKRTKTTLPETSTTSWLKTELHIS